MLLPIVKDLLQKAINVGMESEYGMNIVILAISLSRYSKPTKDRRKREKQEKKAMERKHEKKKDKTKGKHKPSFGSIGDDVAAGDYTEDVPYGITSDDPTTIRNTLQNSSTSLSGANGIQSNESDTILSPRSLSHTRVSFDSTPAIIDEKEAKDLKGGRPFSDSSDSSDSCTASESSSDDDKPVTRAQDTAASKPAMPYRKIKAVGNKIHVLTQSGQAYECQRYCPHKVCMWT